MSATENFEIAAEALYNEAPTDKARAFVDKLANQIRDKGEAWIEANAIALHITDIEVADHEVSIEANRLFYLECWQDALAK